jgi:hypothetical protein
MIKTQFILRLCLFSCFLPCYFACSDDSSTANPADDATKAVLLEESARIKSTSDDRSDPVRGVGNPV